jgi:hypothetical protein
MNLTLNGLPIVVDQVAAEEIVRRHLLNGDTAVAAIAPAGAAHIPQLKAGKKYLGAHCGPDGKLVHTILLPGVARGKNWQAAMEWAVDQGGYLPNRIEGAMLFAYLKSEFENEVYWLGEQSADGSGYAWLQGFDDGIQLYWHKDYKYMARAVRRVSI